MLEAWRLAQTSGQRTEPSDLFRPHGLRHHGDAASDGDIFSYFFKKYKLGPLIGIRTWGGVRGIRGYIPLMDGGYITRPEFSVYGVNREWVVENHGVEPELRWKPPDQVMKGDDPQLEKAIELVTQQIREHPEPGVPPRPPDLPTYPPDVVNGGPPPHPSIATKKQESADRRDPARGETWARFQRSTGIYY